MSDGIARVAVLRRNEKPGAKIIPMVLWLSLCQRQMGLLICWFGIVLSPGKIGTDWEGGYFPLTINFSEDYPSKPPICKFPNGFFHPNVYPSGNVCSSILSERRGWRPSITVTQILVGIQDLLDQPNASDYAQTEGYRLYISNPDLYRERVQQQVLQYPPSL